MSAKAFRPLPASGEREGRGQNAVALPDIGVLNLTRRCCRISIQGRLVERIDDAIDDLLDQG
jgi:hypothetical protein